MSKMPKPRANLGAFWENKTTVEERLGRTVSRQYLQQLWLRENQMCVLCWKKLDVLSIDLKRRMCSHCDNKQAKQKRKIWGHEPWVFDKKEGRRKRGRAPLTNVTRDGKPITTFELAMSKINYEQSNKEISALYDIHISTVRKYRKIYHDKPFLLLQEVFSTTNECKVTEEKP